jgi:hypothetical protein
VLVEQQVAILALHQVALLPLLDLLLQLAVVSVEVMVTLQQQVVQVVAVIVKQTARHQEVLQVHQDKATLVEVDLVAVAEVAQVAAVKMAVEGLDITQVILTPAQDKVGTVLLAAQVEAELH